LRFSKSVQQETGLILILSAGVHLKV